MFDIEASFDRVVLSEPRDRPTVLFAEPDDPRMVEAACFLARYIRPVFLGRESDVRALIASGKSITAAAGAAAAAERSRWQLFDDFHARNATAAFSEIEWE